MSLPVASTQYNDMVGTSAIDWHGSTELRDFANTKGIDTKRYFPIGISFSGVPPNYFTIFAVDTKLIQPDFDKISDYAAKQDGVLPVVQFNFSSTLDEASKFMKRLEVVALTKVKHLQSLHPIESIDLD
jgi:hypothetical protein